MGQDDDEWQKQKSKRNRTIRTIIICIAIERWQTVFVFGVQNINIHEFSRAQILPSKTKPTVAIAVQRVHVCVSRLYWTSSNNWFMRFLVKQSLPLKWPQNLLESFLFSLGIIFVGVRTRACMRMMFIGASQVSPLRSTAANKWHQLSHISMCNE